MEENVVEEKFCKPILSSFGDRFGFLAGPALFFLAACILVVGLTVSARLAQGQESPPVVEEEAATTAKFEGMATVAEEPAPAEEAYILVPDARPDVSKMGLPTEDVFQTTVSVERVGGEDGFILKTILVVHVADGKRWDMDNGNVVLMHMLPGSDEPILFQWLIKGEEGESIFIAFVDGPIYVNGLDTQFEVTSMESRQFRITSAIKDEEGQPTISQEFTVPAASAEEPAS